MVATLHQQRARKELHVKEGVNGLRRTAHDDERRVVCLVVVLVPCGCGGEGRATNILPAWRQQWEGSSQSLGGFTECLGDSAAMAGGSQMSEGAEWCALGGRY